MGGVPGAATFTGSLGFGRGGVRILNGSRGACVGLGSGCDGAYREGGRRLLKRTCSGSVAGCDRISSRGVLSGRARSWVAPVGLAGNPEKRAGAISVPGCGMICFRGLLVCFLPRGRFAE